MTGDGGGTGHVSRRGALGTIAAAGAAALAGCVVGASGGDRGSVAIAGSSTVYPVSKTIAEAHFKANPDAEVTVSSTGTGAGFSNFFCRGKTDINDASRAIKDSERAMCAEHGVTPIEFQIATDALTVIVNPEADWIGCLNFTELRSIWGPDDPPTQWDQANEEWPDADLNLYGPTAASGTFDFFTETVMGESGSSRADYQKTEQDNAIVTAVARDRYAMGYLGFSYYIENRDRLTGVPITEEAGGECVEPTFETAEGGRYPLARPLFIYVAKESLADPGVRDFVSYYLEQSHGELIRQVGYVPVSDSVAADNRQRFERAVEEVTTP